MSALVEWRFSGPIETFIASGGTERPRAVIVAGVHGDEYEGPAAVAQLARRIPEEQLEGTVIAIPVANPLAFAAARRTTPEDGLNLARTFPGRRDGSETERLASYLFDNFIADASFVIDLHSGGVEYQFIPVAGFYGDARRGNPSYDAARRFGLRHLWQLPQTPGVLSFEAWKRNIPAIGMEYLGAGRLSPEGVHAYVEGVLSCLAYWGVLRNRQPLSETGEVIHGDWMLAEAGGIFHARLSLGAPVQTGERIADIVDLRGRVLQHFVAPAAGIVAGLRSKAYIPSGDWGVLLGTREPFA